MGRQKKKAADAPNGNGGSIKELLDGLWEAAVKLRGSIEPADYKRYVLPIIFLRFLSLRYDRRRAELEALIADPKSDYHTTNRKHADAILNNPDEYQAAGAFVVPEAARWAKIVETARRDDIKLQLDNVLELLETTYPQQLRGLLPRIYAGSNMHAEDLRGLINLFSKEVFERDHGGTDLIGRVYEYFIGEFASSEGKRGGEYFTPQSIVKLLVAMLEPTRGVVFDPCCGSGGMFVQSDLFTGHNHELTFYGQESKDFTYRLCRMNLFIHGIEGNIELGNSYWDDKHPKLRADYVLANPPFNDGSKSESGWGADRIPDKDPRLTVGAAKLPLSPRNANTMWMLHFLHHLKDGGTAGFVMATGELSNGETARLEVRKTLVEADHVDCVVQLTGQLFANTQIPCCLWFLSKSRAGAGGFRKRAREILFIDGRKLGTLIPGSRKQKQLAAEEVARVTGVYRQFRRAGRPAEQPGFCKVATLEEVRGHKYALTPGRYVGSAEADDDGEPFEEKLPRLTAQLKAQMQESAKLDRAISAILEEVANGG
jgi:type I restriction enzyme M protein